jgi:putative transposase
MTRLEDRQRTARSVDEACREGARLSSGCEVAGIDPRTLQRCKTSAGLERGDGRPHAVKPLPAHALSTQEREQILHLVNEPRFAELPPARIVPMLADEGIYIASESSFNRVLGAHGQARHRGR